MLVKLHIELSQICSIQNDVIVKHVYWCFCKQITSKDETISFLNQVKIFLLSRKCIFKK